MDTFEPLSLSASVSILPLILSEKGETFGTDPRTVGVDTLNAAGHQKRPLLRVIREKCLDCCVGQVSEVRKCTAVDCSLWPYRMVTNPFSAHKGNVSNLKKTD